MRGKGALCVVRFAARRLGWVSGEECAEATGACLYNARHLIARDTVPGYASRLVSGMKDIPLPQADTPRLCRLVPPVRPTTMNPILAELMGHEARKSSKILRLIDCFSLIAHLHYGDCQGALVSETSHACTQSASTACFPLTQSIVQCFGMFHLEEPSSECRALASRE